MSRSITFGAIALAAASIAPLSINTVQAQGMDSGDAITVTAPHKRVTGRSASGAPIETMEAQSVVYFGDLNLATRSGQDELRHRVANAADSACRWLDEVFPTGPNAEPPTLAECRREAIKRAASQVNDAIALGG
jgi:UrcA family protein